MKNSRKRRKEAVITRRLVVIGNGMAATRLVQRLVERDPARFAITVVGDEPHPAYNRIQLSPLLAGEKTAAQIPLLPTKSIVYISFGCVSLQQKITHKPKVNI